MNKTLLRYYCRDRAIDMAVWQNISKTSKQNAYGAIWSADGGYLVVPTNHPTFSGEDFEILPISYQQIGFTHIERIYLESKSLPHWQILRHMVSCGNDDLLRFILFYKVPLKRFIRYELASRGIDHHGHWVGFDQAKTIWLI